MKCQPHCTCGKHHAVRRMRRLPSGRFAAPLPITVPYNNTTHSPKQRALTTTYGQQQRNRVQLATQERRRRGTKWRGTPSETFDWERAFAGWRRIWKEVNG